mmetsp:Transcript_31521/g.64454  ORF Transcript_31521/g.64454 Transcript_31521/m.64454 type:complete len:237 (+) Transcript_31521:201-911(+)
MSSTPTGTFTLMLSASPPSTSTFMLSPSTPVGGSAPKDVLSAVGSSDSFVPTGIPLGTTSIISCFGFITSSIAESTIICLSPSLSITDSFVSTASASLLAAATTAATAATATILSFVSGPTIGVGCSINASDSPPWGIFSALICIVLNSSVSASGPSELPPETASLTLACGSNSNPNSRSRRMRSSLRRDLCWSPDFQILYCLRFQVPNSTSRKDTFSSLTWAPWLREMRTWPYLA